MKKLLALFCAVAVLGLCGATSLAKGCTVAPAAGDWNTVTFKRGDETAAKLSFKADSDPDNFYAGLSTDWDDCAQKDLFAEQDAYFFGFVINPSVPAAGIPALTLYNPYRDKEGSYTREAGDLFVYEITSGGVKEVTDSFTPGTDGDGEQVLQIKTRRPGIYVLAEQKVSTGPEKKNALRLRVVS